MAKKKLTEEQIEEVLVAAREDLAEIKAEQDALREKELKIRNHVADLVNDKDEGAVTVKLSDGSKCVVTRSINYSIKVADALRLKADNPKLYATLLSFSPQVRGGVFKSNSEDAGDYVTTSDAPPTVKFEIG